MKENIPIIKPRLIAPEKEEEEEVPFPLRRVKILSPNPDAQQNILPIRRKSA